MKGSLWLACLLSIVISVLAHILLVLSWSAIAKLHANIAGASSKSEPDLQVYINPIFDNYLTYFEGPLEKEPNNSPKKGNGPLFSDVDYYGYPNDLTDYFSIYLESDGYIGITLTDHTGQGVQIQLFYEVVDPTISPVADDRGTPGQIEYFGKSGLYFIYIYTESGHNNSDLYKLRVTHPSISTPTPVPTITPSPTPTVLFSDDFENGTNNWQINDPGWQVREDETGNHFYCVNATGDYVFAQTGSIDWQDYALEVDIMIVTVSDYGSGNILFRISEDFSPLYVYGFYEGGAVLGKEDPQFRVLDSTSQGPIQGNWHTIRIEAVGVGIKVFMDGRQEPILQATDPDPYS